MPMKTDSEKLNILKNLSAKHGCRILFDEPLERHTTFRIGGPCDMMIFPNSVTSLSELISAAASEKIKHIVIGNGSNILFSDNGYRGVVFAFGTDMSTVSVDGELVSACAGAPLSRVCHAALEASLTGMEFAWGIPGTVGGAVFMNAGAYNGEIKDILIDVTAISSAGEIKTYTRDEVCFGYRSSVFSHTDEVIASARFKLSKGDSSAIKARMDELMARRKAHQPLEYPNAGSMFKRPEGTYAGLVIEECGLKGYSIGGAQVSLKHANFIVNTGGATADDVIALISYIKAEVLEKTGYRLECEVELIDE